MGEFAEGKLRRWTGRRGYWGDKFGMQDSARTGIWLRYQNEENFLAFMFNNRSNYRIARFEGEYDDSRSGSRPAAINTGQKCSELD